MELDETADTQQTEPRQGGRETCKTIGFKITFLGCIGALCIMLACLIPALWPIRGYVPALVGIFYDTQAQHQKALPYYEKAREILHEAGDRVGEGVILGSIGDVHPLGLRQPRRARHIAPKLC